MIKSICPLLLFKYAEMQRNVFITLDREKERGNSEKTSMLRTSWKLVVFLVNFFQRVLNKVHR